MDYLKNAGRCAVDTCTAKTEDYNKINSDCIQRRKKSKPGWKLLGSPGLLWKCCLCIFSKPVRTVS